MELFNDIFLTDAKIGGKAISHMHTSECDIVAKNKLETGITIDRDSIIKVIGRIRTIAKKDLGLEEDKEVRKIKIVSEGRKKFVLVVIDSVVTANAYI